MLAFHRLPKAEVPLKHQIFMLVPAWVAVHRFASSKVGKIAHISWALGTVLFRICESPYVHAEILKSSMIIDFSPIWDQFHTTHKWCWLCQYHLYIKIGYFLLLGYWAVTKCNGRRKQDHFILVLITLLVGWHVASPFAHNISIS